MEPTNQIAVVSSFKNIFNGNKKWLTFLLLFMFIFFYSPIVLIVLYCIYFSLNRYFDRSLNEVELMLISSELIILVLVSFIYTTRVNSSGSIGLVFFLPLIFIFFFISYIFFLISKNLPYDNIRNLISFSVWMLVLQLCFFIENDYFGTSLIIYTPSLIVGVVYAALFLLGVVGLLWKFFSNYFGD